jgi:hypothetical protein
VSVEENAFEDLLFQQGNCMRFSEHNRLLVDDVQEPPAGREIA